MSNKVKDLIAMLSPSWIEQDDPKLNAGYFRAVKCLEDALCHLQLGNVQVVERPFWLSSVR
jgi:hypothetical protein